VVESANEDGKSALTIMMLAGLSGEVVAADRSTSFNGILYLSDRSCLFPPSQPSLEMGKLFVNWDSGKDII
jgi:hypothetical protein